MSQLMNARPRHALILSVTAIGLIAAGCSSGNPAPATTVTKTAANGSTTVQTQAGSTPAAPSPTATPATPVGMTTLNSDGAEYGVGMPVIVFFTKKPTDARAFQEATKTTVDGKAIAADWYFEFSSATKGYPVEAHLRPQAYWKAHSKVHVGFAPSGTSLGKGLALKTKLTSLDFSIGASNITTVDNSTHKVTVVSDGREIGSYPTSLGASNTRTRRGIKVIMEKGASICMKGPGYNECGVKWTQRLTYDGEYLHAAPWNTRNIANGVNSSNGCTNLTTPDAKTLYGELRVGDVVAYPNADGPKMQLGQGYGDWNVSWGEWQTGGLVSTT
ncbi:MAG: L,D-transpeptidase [Jatrophihabitans sp.]